GASGAELWKSDGTEEGTRPVLDILPGLGGSNPAALTAVNETLYFSASGDGESSVLWQSDGTPAGTVPVQEVASPGSRQPKYMTNVTGQLFSLGAPGLWKSDGTGAGTVLLRPLVAPAGFLDQRYMTNISGTLYFRAGDAANGQELWKSDGTPAGTILLKDTVG